MRQIRELVGFRLFRNFLLAKPSEYAKSQLPLLIRRKTKSSGFIRESGGSCGVSLQDPSLTSPLHLEGEVTRCITPWDVLPVPTKPENRFSTALKNRFAASLRSAWLSTKQRTQALPMSFFCEGRNSVLSVKTRDNKGEEEFTLYTGELKQIMN